MQIQQVSRKQFFTYSVALKSKQLMIHDLRYRLEVVFLPDGAWCDSAKDTQKVERPNDSISL